MRILAIDPGYERLGLAILEKKNEDRKERVIFSECFKTSSKEDFYKRIFLIGSKIEDIIQKYKPEVLAIEKLYFEKNQKTAMGVSEARGVIIYECIKKSLDVFEYTPLEIKTAICGYGKATKEMIMNMVPKLVSLENISNSDDELDAIAIGITCFASINLSKLTKKQI